MKIVFLEFTDEYLSFCEYLKNKKSSITEYKIIAIEPKLQAYLRSKNVDFEDSSEYIDSNSHRVFIEESEKISEIISKNFIYADSNTVETAYKNDMIHYVRFYVNHFLKTIELLDNVCKKYPGVVMHLFVNRILNTSLILTDNERFIGLFAEQYANKKNIKLISLGCTENKQMSIKKRENLFLSKIYLKYAEKNIAGKKVAFMPQSGIIGKALSRYLLGCKKIYLEASGTGSVKIIKTILKNIFTPVKQDAVNINVDLLPNMAHKSDIYSLQKAVDNMSNTIRKADLSYKALNYGEYIAEKINYAVKPYLLQMLENTAKIKYLFSMAEDCIVISHLSIGVMSCAGELARRMGKHSLFISHGAHPEPVDDIHEKELLMLCRNFMLSEYTDIALSTPVQERHIEYFKSKYDFVKNNEIKTGPIIFSLVNRDCQSKDKMRFGIKSNVFTLVHATTMKSRSAERFYFIESFEEYFKSLADLIKVVDVIENTKLIIRLHPGFILTNDELTAILPKSENYIISRIGPFNKVLSAADMVVSYSSTAIDEALINGIPVLLYDRWNRYNHYRTQPYEKGKERECFPVCYVNNSGNISGAVNYMINRISRKDYEDKDFSNYRYDMDCSGNLEKYFKEILS